MNDLGNFFSRRTGRFALKWKHYLEIYDARLGRFRGRKVTLLEIGVYAGGSLEMWREYLGPDANIIGVDIDSNCSAFAGGNTSVFIGSQSDRSFLKSVAQRAGPIDIIIDDGGHGMRQQCIAFETLYEHLSDGGIYICEDLHTSYWLNFGGGHRRKGTYIERCKALVDSINAWHSDQRSLRRDKYTESIFSISFYTSMVVIEKRAIEPPMEIFRGDESTRPPINREKPRLLWRMWLLYFYNKEKLRRILRMDSYF